MALIKNNAIWPPGCSGKGLKECDKSYKEAITALEKQKDIPPMTVPEGLLKSVTKFVAN